MERELEPGQTVWQGKFAELINNVGYAAGSYSRIKEKLIQIGCIHMIRKGTSAYPTQIQLVKRPELSVFLEAVEQDAATKKEVRTKKESQNQMILDLNARVLALETAVRQLQDIRRQITYLIPDKDQDED